MNIPKIEYFMLLDKASSDIDAKQKWFDNNFSKQ